MHGTGSLQTAFRRVLGDAEALSTSIHLPADRSSARGIGRSEFAQRKYCAKLRGGRERMDIHSFVNVRSKKRRVPAGAKAKFCWRFNVGAEAPTLGEPFKR